jgi:iron complex transport system permease protein
VPVAHPIQPPEALGAESGRPGLLSPLRGARPASLLALLAVIAVATVASIALGSRTIPLDRIAGALAHPDANDPLDAIVTQLRLPRTVLAVVVGAALGACGVLLQALTRNPLADPSIVGIEAGAALAVVIAIGSLGIGGAAAYAPFALVGGMLAGGLAWLLGGGERSSPTTLALAGAAVTALAVAVTQGLTVADAATLDRFRFWLVGSVAGRDWSVLLGAAPFLAAGALAAIAAAPALNTLALGEDVARALGQRVGVVRVAAGAAALLLAAGAVAVAGPISLVGLVAAHSARALVGPDVRWQLAHAALLGATYVLVADVVGRLIVPPREIQTGVVCALVGVPVFLLLIRRRRVRA